MDLYKQTQKIPGQQVVYLQLAECNIVLSLPHSNQTACVRYPTTLMVTGHVCDNRKTAGEARARECCEVAGQSIESPTAQAVQYRDMKVHSPANTPGLLRRVCPGRAGEQR